MPEVKSRHPVNKTHKKKNWQNSQKCPSRRIQLHRTILRSKMQIC